MKAMLSMLVVVIAMMALLTNADARYYDPMEGVFISKDPVSFAGGDVNLYRYVGNNPVNYVDPTGLSPEDVQRLLAESKAFTDQMTRTGQRTDPGVMNNLLISCRALGICKNDYNGCGGQSDALKDHLNDYIKNSPLDDTWTINKVYNLPVHFNLRATSSNPSDPILILDPHANQFKVKK